MNPASRIYIAGHRVLVGSAILRNLQARGYANFVLRTHAELDLEKKNSDTAFDRSLELLDLTIADPRHRRRLRELTRLREALADYFVFDNGYGSTDVAWQKYFHAFTYAAAIRKGR